jgi:hypothetical protein
VKGKSRIVFCRIGRRRRKKPRQERFLASLGMTVVCVSVRVVSLRIVGACWCVLVSVEQPPIISDIYA